jgi:hypothetical protein
VEHDLKRNETPSSVDYGTVLTRGLPLFGRSQKAFLFIEQMIGEGQGGQSGTKLMCANGLLSFLSFVGVDRLYGLVVRVPGYRSEMCCDSCEVRTEFMCVI